MTGFADHPRTTEFDWAKAARAVERDKLIAKGDLYFVRLGDSVKIGHTRNIVKRLANMQVGTPEPLNCLAVLQGQGWQEPVWHRAFEDRRRGGEWFRWGHQLETAISLAREGKDWWDHLSAPLSALGDLADLPDEDDDLIYAHLDWHISLKLQTVGLQERMANEPT